jgi:LysM repeat protein
VGLGLAMLACCVLLVGQAPGGGRCPAAWAAGKKAKKGKKQKKGDDGGKVLVWLRVGKVVKGGVKVTVQPGQRLQDISETYGVSIATLKGANPGLNPAAIWAGQKILVPGATKVLAIKTWVPEDKLDDIPGMKSSDTDAGGGKKHKKKGKKDGPLMVKSGKKVPGGVKHTIQPGQSLGIIAAAYGVSVSKIVKASGIKNPDAVKPGQTVMVPGAGSVVAVKAKPQDGQSLVEEHTVKSGKVVKAGVLHTVQPGQTLGIISAAYSVKVSSILKVNKLKNANSIKQGQKLLIPGAKKVVAVKADPSKALATATKIKFHRIHTGETKTITLYNANGKLVKSEYKKFEKMMFDQHTGKKHKIHPRLCYMLKLVAEHWPDHMITIYSGFRAYNPKQYTKKSKHNLGRAIDFAVDGVSNLKLMKFCRTLKNVGVGYYPNSYFVHLDVRETSAFWVDYGGPGEAPKYKKWKKGKKGGKGSGGVNLEADSDAADVDVKKK